VPQAFEVMDKPCFANDCATCPGRLVCRCLQISEEVLVEALTTLGLKTLQEVREATGAGDGCTCCHKKLRYYLEVVSYSSSASPICSVK
jgi:bacterioferritin-associated ferredoxin